MIKNMNKKALFALAVAVMFVFVFTIFAPASGENVNITNVGGILTLENAAVRYTINQKGEVTSFYSKLDNTEYINTRGYAGYLTTTDGMKAIPQSMRISYDPIKSDIALVTLVFKDCEVDMKFTVYDEFIFIQVQNEVPDNYDCFTYCDLGLKTSYLNANLAVFPCAVNVNTQMVHYPSMYKMLYNFWAKTYPRYGTENSSTILITCPSFRALHWRMHPPPRILSRYTALL